MANSAKTSQDIPLDGLGGGLKGYPHGGKNQAYDHW